MRNVNKWVSNTFRILVGIHLAALCVLTFGLKDTLFGFWHTIVAIGLTILMVSIAALFIWDMATPNDASRKSAKLIDGLIGAGWLALVGFLILNSERAGFW
jgi:hypothetical protein